MPELTDRVTMKGNPVTLLGKQLEIGDDAPNAVLVANDLSEVSLSSFKGKTVVLSIVPSLDTGICDLQTKRFNKEAQSWGDKAVVLTVSVDLPFAQKRWCGATGSENVKTLSAYRNRQFGQDYGVFIKGLELLARSVFVVGPDGKVVYKQLVPEITTEPNYDEVIAAVK